jgi:hypothetical protein
LSEAEHFKRCPLSGGYIDFRDRAWIDEHLPPLPQARLGRDIAADGGLD